MDKEEKLQENESEITWNPGDIARSTSNLHKKILEKIGVNTIVSPDKDMGIRLAKGIMDINVMEAINISDNYDIVEIKARDKWI